MSESGNSFETAPAGASSSAAAASDRAGKRSRLSALEAEVEELRERLRQVSFLIRRAAVRRLLTSNSCCFCVQLEELVLQLVRLPQPATPHEVVVLNPSDDAAPLAAFAADPAATPADDPIADAATVTPATPARALRQVSTATKADLQRAVDQFAASGREVVLRQLGLKMQSIRDARQWSADVANRFKMRFNGKLIQIVDKFLVSALRM
jgi:hypothetical protein